MITGSQDDQERNWWYLSSVLRLTDYMITLASNTPVMHEINPNVVKVHTDR